MTVLILKNLNTLGGEVKMKKECGHDMKLIAIMDVL